MYLSYILISSLYFRQGRVLVYFHPLIHKLVSAKYICVANYSLFSLLVEVVLFVFQS